MKAAFGYAALALGAGACIVGISALIAGIRMHDAVLLRIGRRCVFVVLLAAVLAAAMMEWALISHDFSIRYVAENNARGTPLLFTITGLWASLEGSILLWGVILGGYLTFVAHKFRRRGRRSAGGSRADHRPRRCAVLLPADARARQPVQHASRPSRSTAAGRTRCCRTTS